MRLLGLNFVTCDYGISAADYKELFSQVPRSFNYDGWDAYVRRYAKTNSRYTGIASVLMDPDRVRSGGTSLQAGDKYLKQRCEAADGNEPEAEHRELNHGSEYNIFSCMACDRRDTDEMIKCDSSSHEEDSGWFHYHCVALTEHSLPDEWFCPECRHRHQPAKVPGRLGAAERDMEDTVADRAHHGSQNSNRQHRKSNPRTEQQDRPSADGVNREPPLRAKAQNRGKAIRKLSLSGASRPTADAPERQEKPQQLENDVNPTASSKVDRERKEWNNKLERDCMAAIMRKVYEEEGNESWRFTDKKWEIISKRINEFGFEHHRTANSVKFYWQRRGRFTYGIDERKTRNPQRLSTSVEDPAVRKKRREELKQKKGSNRKKRRSIFRTRSIVREIW